MPYIKPSHKIEVLNFGATSSGELNYAITTLLINYWKSRINSSDPLRYQTINDILGALEGAKLEFYRRVAVPFEEEKIKTNGDVY